ncbi:hypothetical protein BI362_11185 [Streptococcus parauberis]|nr:hypothetical protein BI362_11185 [Streptococcus parauberis]
MNDKKNIIYKIDNNDKDDISPMEGELIESDVTVKFNIGEAGYRKNEISKFFDIFKIGKEFKDIIDPKKEYVVKFLPELLEKINNHDMEFLVDSNGNILPTMYDHTEKSIGGQIRLELRGNVTPQQWQHLGDSISHAMEQAKLESLSNQLIQIQNSVQRIQEGQDSDRFAEILTGIELLDDAKNMTDEVNRIETIQSALKSLKTGTNKVKLALCSELDSLPDVKDSKFSRIIFTVRNPENRSKLHSSYNQIQIYFENYYKGLLHLSEAYTLMGESQRIDALISSSSEILHHENLYRLTNIEKLLPIGYDYSINWYNNPLKIEKRIEESYSADKVSELISLTISGHEILKLKESEEYNE